MLKQFLDFDVKHPFKTFATDPAYDGKFNGVTGFLMQSDENVDKVIKRAKKNLLFYSLEDSLVEALNYYNLSKADFTDSDYNKLLRWAHITED